jgi:hypothetical protein
VPEGEKTMTHDYRVCKGTFLVNGERIPVNGKVLKIGLAAAGLDEAACGPLGERDARRILHLERSLLLSGLTRELRRAIAAGQAA